MFRETKMYIFNLLLRLNMRTKLNIRNDTEVGSLGNRESSKEKDSHATFLQNLRDINSWDI